MARPAVKEPAALALSWSLPVQLDLPFLRAPAPEPAGPLRSIDFVRMRRARRYIIRVRPDGSVRVTVPRGGSRLEAARFLEKHALWIAQERARVRAAHVTQAWMDGATMLLRGEPVKIRVADELGGRLVRYGSRSVAVSAGDTDLRRCIEGDLRTFAGELAKPPEQRNADFSRMIGRLHSAIEHFHRMPHPVVGQVHGAVAGFGLSLMNACDLVVAADDAYFASAYGKIALTPDGGGSWSLPRIVGMRQAMEILLLGERFDARRALELGLVNRVVPAAELENAVGAIVQSLANGPVMAIRNAKRLLRESPGRTLSQQLDAEAVSFGACAGTADFVEGITAFLEKRQAKFGK